MANLFEKVSNIKGKGGPLQVGAWQCTREKRGPTGKITFSAGRLWKAEDRAPWGSEELTCDSHFNNQSGSKPTNKNPDVQEGLSWPAQKCCEMGPVFSLPRFQPAHGLWSQQAPSSILSTACVSAPRWLRGRFFSFVVMTGQLYDIFSSAGFARQRRDAPVELPALSFHKATRAAAMLASLAAFPAPRRVLFRADV